ncbi:MAG: GDSL-type esterase/lipase family protein [Polyangiaceae bacterium]
MRPVLVRRALFLSLAVHAMTAALVLAYRLRPRVEPPSAGEYRAGRLALFETLGVPSGALVIVGDSISDRAEWAELLGRADVVNRAIAGETVRGALEWIERAANPQARGLAVLLGVNDLLNGRKPAEVAVDYGALLARVRSSAPELPLLAVGVLPVRDGSAGAGFVSPVDIAATNTAIRASAEEHGATFADPGRDLRDSSGALDADLTTDGVHLNGVGYRRLASALAPALAAMKASP